MTHRRLEKVFEAPVGELLPKPARMAATVHLPPQPDPDAPVLFLFPGATYARAYYDIQADGFEGYSQAEHHAAEGMLSIAFDHLGTGDSPYEEATMNRMAAAADGAARAALAEIRAGTLDPALPAMKAATAVGIGQSMGGHVVVRAQAAHRTFDAVGTLGSSFTHTRLAMKPGQRFPARGSTPAEVIGAVMAGCDIVASFHWPETPEALVELDFNQAAPAPWRAGPPFEGGSLLLAGASASEAGQVGSPVLLAYGESDVSPEPLADVAAFRWSPDIHMKVVPGMSHMHNFGPNRQAMWRLISGFARRVAAQG